MTASMPERKTPQEMFEQADREYRDAEASHRRDDHVLQIKFGTSEDAREFLEAIYSGRPVKPSAIKELTLGSSRKYRAGGPNRPDERVTLK